MSRMLSLSHQNYVHENCSGEVKVTVEKSKYLGTYLPTQNSKFRVQMELSVKSLDQTSGKLPKR